jgi:predicted nucleotidyltransferase component of viral defense system
MLTDPSLFADVADALGIKNPVIVEKDYYAVQLIQALSLLSFDDYHLVFSGGTCLAKAHQNTYRMSEDIDFKLVPSLSFSGSQGQKRNKRRAMHEKISSVIESSKLFKVIDFKKLSEGKYQTFLIQYPIHHPKIDALRPHLKLELTESYLLEPVVMKPISSLYAEVAKESPEIEGFSCASISSIASEKFVALLRRTAAFDRDNTKDDDETLVRHVYDLHLIRNLLNSDALKEFVHRVIQIDVDQFGNQCNQFKNNPFEELQHGLKLLLENPIHKKRYEMFIGPLVYNPEAASWEDAISTISELAHLWLS